MNYIQRRERKKTWHSTADNLFLILILVNFEMHACIVNVV